MATYLDAKLAAGAKIESASHTIDHTSLSTQTYDVQVGVCTTSKSQIAQSLPHNTMPITTMICPYDQFNTDTLYVLSPETRFSSSFPFFVLVQFFHCFRKLLRTNFVSFVLYNSFTVSESCNELILSPSFVLHCSTL